jgi:hypothetical protein
VGTVLLLLIRIAQLLGSIAIGALMRGADHIRAEANRRDTLNTNIDHRQNYPFEEEVINGIFPSVQDKAPVFSLVCLTI